MPSIPMPEGRPDGLLQSLRQARDLARTRAWAMSTLGSIGSGEFETAAVRHPLGFLCLPIYRGSPLGLCVHLWPAAAGGENDRCTPTHAHSWALTGLVLFGEICNELVQVTDSHVPTHRIFCVSSYGGVDVVTTTSRLVREVILLREHLSAGRTYTLRPGSFHRTAFPRRGVAATLVFGEHHPSARDYMLGDLDQGQRRIERRSCGGRELRRVIGAALAQTRQDSVYPSGHEPSLRERP